MPDPRTLKMLDQLEMDYPAGEYPEIADAAAALKAAIEAESDMGEDEEAPAEEAPAAELPELELDLEVDDMEDMG